MLAVTGVILAGGKAERMGGTDKGLVHYKGVPMVEQVLQRLSGLDEVLINLNRAESEAYEKLPCSIIPDELHPQIGTYAGPLLGILSGLKAASNQWVLFSPCDTPELPQDYANRMIEAAQEKMTLAVVANDGERTQPLHLLLNKRLHESLLMFLLSGQRKTFGWLNQIKPYEVDFSDCHNGFVNINYLNEVVD